MRRGPDYKRELWCIPRFALGRGRSPGAVLPPQRATVVSAPPLYGTKAVAAFDEATLFDEATFMVGPSRYLRKIDDDSGYLYPWTAALARRPDMYEV